MFPMEHFLTSPTAKLIDSISERGWRRVIGWTGALFLMAILSAIAFAYWRAAVLGVSIPDLTGGFIPIAVSIAPLLVGQITRHLEVSKQRDPWPSGGLVNPNGGPVGV